MNEKKPVRSYRDLQVWQLAMDLVEGVYRTTATFPKHEMYGLASQIQRSAVSLPSNIAEGHARDSTKEFLHHLSFTVGSQAELETQILLAGRLGYLKRPVVEDIFHRTQELGRKLFKLKESLKRKL